MQIILKNLKIWHLNLIPKAQESTGSQIFALFFLKTKVQSKAAGGYHTTNGNHKLIKLSNNVIKKQKIDS